MSSTTIIRLAALFGALGVAAGAFGAHGLRETLTPERLAVWNTAARYQMLHAVVLLAIGVGYANLAAPAASWSAGLVVAGIVVFSGSLYALCLTNVGVLGAVTPIGGLALIAGWVALWFAAAGR